MRPELVARLDAAVAGMRDIAAPHGSMHALWDWICELEETKAGRRGVLRNMTVEEKVAHCEAIVARNRR